MATLSANQVAVYATAAGFAGSNLIDAVSVAMAESSGNTSAVNLEGNTGLWQVGPKGTRNDAGVGLTQVQLLDPAVNAQAAHSIWARAGGTFAKDWSTWGTGPQVAWAAKLRAGNWGAPATGAGSLGGDIASGAKIATNAVGLGGIDAIAADVDKVGKWVTTPANWVRVAFVIIGGVLVIAGLNAVARPVTAPVVASAKKTGETVAKVAAVAAA